MDMEVSNREGVMEKVYLDRDEQLARFDEKKLRVLKPINKVEEGTEGTITAGNSSACNDGAAAILLVSYETAVRDNLEILAVVEGYAEKTRNNADYGLAPVDAINVAVKKAHLNLDSIDYFEINEAFSVVALANRALLDIPPERLNVFGGAVALGHPIGASGCRIVCTLLSVLKQKKGRYGCAAICNGGGGASAIVVRLVDKEEKEKGKEEEKEKK